MSFTKDTCPHCGKEVDGEEFANVLAAGRLSGLREAKEAVNEILGALGHYLQPIIIAAIDRLMEVDK